LEHGSHDESDVQVIRCDDDLLESQQLYPYTFKDFGTMIYISNVQAQKIQEILAIMHSSGSIGRYET